MYQVTPPLPPPPCSDGEHYNNMPVNRKGQTKEKHNLSDHKFDILSMTDVTLRLKRIKKEKKKGKLNEATKQKI